MKPFFFDRKVQVPLYKQTFRMIFSNDLDKINKRLHSVEVDDELWAQTFSDVDKDEHEIFTVVFFFNEPSTPPITHGIITHESLHITNLILAKAGVKLKTNNDEASAYLIQWVVDQITFFLKEKNLLNRIEVAK